MAGPHDKLTDKQQRFVEEFLRNGRNATAAYKFAYAFRGKDQTAGAAAFVLLRHVKIAPIIEAAERHRASQLDFTAERYQIRTKEDLIQRMAALGSYEVTDFFRRGEGGEWVLKDLAEISREAAFAITEIGYDSRGKLRLKFADRRACIMDVAKLKGWVTERQALVDADTGKAVEWKNTFVFQVGLHNPAAAGQDEAPGPSGQPAATTPAPRGRGRPPGSKKRG